VQNNGKQQFFDFLDRFSFYSKRFNHIFFLIKLRIQSPDFEQFSRNENHRKIKGNYVIKQF